MFASPRQSGRAEAPVGRCVGDHIQAGQIGDRAVVFGLWMSVVPQSARVNGSERGESRQDAEAHSLLAARAFRRTPQPARSAGATDRVRSRLRLHGGRCRRERELKRCHTSPRREPIRGPGEGPIRPAAACNGYRAGSPASTAKDPPRHHSTRASFPGGSRRDRPRNQGSGPERPCRAREPTRTRQEPGRFGMLRSSAIKVSALHGIWNGPPVRRTPARIFAVSAASIKYPPSLGPPGRCKKGSTQDRQSIRQARRISSGPRIVLVGEAALNVAVDRNRRLGPLTRG